MEVVAFFPPRGVKPYLGSLKESLQLLATGGRFSWVTAAKVTAYPKEVIEAPVTTAHWCKPMDNCLQDK